MKKSEGLSNQVLGRQVIPMPGLEHIWKLAPNLAGDIFGTIEAVWVQDGNIKFLVRGPMGDFMEVFATHVKTQS